MRAIALAALGLVAACGGTSSPKRDGAPLPKIRVLFLGNSYTEVNDLPGTLVKLGQSPGSVAQFEVESRTPGGQTWEGHDADAEDTALIAKGWDFVVLQDQSEQPWFMPHGVKPALMSLDAKVKAAGAKTVLYMTWARQVDGEAVTYETKFAQDMAVNRYYVQHATAVGATVAPVGRAWERASRDPMQLLYADDHSHPNPLGTYLAAAVMYETLTGSSPDGLGDGGFAIDPVELARLQKITDETFAARAMPAAPLLGTWSLGGAGNDLLSGHTVAAGDATPGTSFGAGKYAAVPYFPELDVRAYKLSFSASRADWALSVAADSFECLVARLQMFSLCQRGTSLQVTVNTEPAVSNPPLEVPVGSLTPGWHRFALDVGATTYSVAIDDVVVASAPLAHGATAVPAPPSAAFTGIAIGARAEYDDVTVSTSDVNYAFTGALADLQLSR